MTICIHFQGDEQVECGDDEYSWTEGKYEMNLTAGNVCRIFRFIDGFEALEDGDCMGEVKPTDLSRFVHAIGKGISLCLDSIPGLDQPVDSYEYKTLRRLEMLAVHARRAQSSVHWV